MVRQLDCYQSDVLPRGGDARRTSKAPALALVPRTPVTPDEDVPVFAHLRASLGLPLDDPRWWPPRPVGELRAPAVDFALPTLDLLERTLAALRAWGAAPSGHGSPATGRHRPA